MKHKKNNVNPRKQQSADRKKAILTAAFEEFTQHGFAMTKMDNIAYHANVSKGSIYTYFSSKEALLEALVQEYILPNLPSDLPGEDDDTDIVQYIQTALLRVMDNVCYGNAGRLLHLIISEGERFPQIAHMYYSKVIAVGMGKITIVLQQADRKGLLKNRGLLEFPQLLLVPILQTMLWSRLFGNFTEIDYKKMLKVYLASIFITADKEG